MVKYSSSCTRWLSVYVSELTTLSCSAESSWWSAQRRTITTSETSSSVSWRWPGSCPQPAKRLPWSGGPARTCVAEVAARLAPRLPYPRRAAAAPWAPSHPAPSPAAAPSSVAVVARPSNRSGTRTTASTTATSPRSYHTKPCPPLC